MGDQKIEQLFDAIFELLFVESAIASGAGQRPSFWQRLSGGKAVASAADQEKAVARLEEAEQSIDLTGGLDEALASCQHALNTFRGKPISGAAWVRRKSRSAVRSAVSEKRKN